MECHPPTPDKHLLTVIAGPTRSSSLSWITTASPTHLLALATLYCLLLAPTTNPLPTKSARLLHTQETGFTLRGPTLTSRPGSMSAAYRLLSQTRATSSSLPYAATLALHPTRPLPLHLLLLFLPLVLKSLSLTSCTMPGRRPTSRNGSRSTTSTSHKAQTSRRCAHLLAKSLQACKLLARLLMVLQPPALVTHTHRPRMACMLRARTGTTGL